MDIRIILNSAQPNALHSYWVIVRTVSLFSLVMRLLFHPTSSHLNITFTRNHWAHFVAMLKDIDTEVKDLNRKTHPVLFQRHLGDGYYVNVKTDFYHVNFASTLCHTDSKSQPDSPKQEQHYHPHR